MISVFCSRLICCHFITVSLILDKNRLLEYTNNSNIFTESVHIEHESSVFFAPQDYEVICYMHNWCCMQVGFLVKQMKILKFGTFVMQPIHYNGEFIQVQLYVWWMNRPMYIPRILIYLMLCLISHVEFLNQVKKTITISFIN